MYRIGLAVLGCVLLACNGKDEEERENNAAKGGNTEPGFAAQFKAASLPYQL